MAFSFWREWTHFKITEDRFDVTFQSQPIVWSNWIIRIIRDRPRSYPEHSLRPHWPDSKRWGSGSIGSSAINYVTRANYFRILLALADLTENGRGEKKYRYKCLRFHGVLQ